MSSLLFLLALIGFAYLVYWTLINDRKAPDRANLGLFAMKKPSSPSGGPGRNSLPQAYNDKK